MSNKELSNEEVVQAAVSGDAQAFNVLCNEYLQVVYNYLYAMCGDAMLAEDITQETFIRAHGNLQRLQAPWNFRAWILRMARNLFLNEIQRESNIENLDEDVILQSHDRGPEKEAVLKDLGQRVRQVIASLPDQHREALVLREFFGYSYNEIAEQMEVSLNHAKVLLHRGRDAFRNAYGVHALLEEPSAMCNELSEMQYALQDGETTTKEERQVRSHVKDCKACQEREAWLMAQSVLLSGIPLVNPPAGLRERVLERTSGRAARPEQAGSNSNLPRLLMGGGIALAGVIVVVLLVLFIVVRPERNDSGITGSHQLPGGAPPPTATETFSTAEMPFRSATPSPVAVGELGLQEEECTFTAHVNLLCREGPGNSNYPVLDSFEAEQSALVVGQSLDSTHLYVIGPDTNVVCAVPSAEEYGTLEGACSELPQMTPPPLPSTAIFTPTPKATTEIEASPTPTTQPPTATVEQLGTISGEVWQDSNFDSIHQGSEPGYGNVTVHLGTGACGSTGLTSVVTAGNGSYSFNNLTAGTYCVSVDIAPVCGEFTGPSTATEYTINLSAGGNMIREFGYQKLVC